MPQIPWGAIDSIMMLTSAIEMLNTQSIIVITPNQDRIAQLLEQSFAKATDYYERLGCEVVADAVKQVCKEWKSLHEILCVIRRLCDWEEK